MPAPYSAGSIFLQVVPSFRGVPEQIAREAREKWADQAGDAFDPAFEKRMQESGKKAGKALSKGLTETAGDAGDKAGEAYAGRFRTQMAKGVAAAQKELGALKVDVNDRAARQKLDSLRKGFANLGGDIQVGMDSGKAMLAFQKLEQRARDLQDKSTSLEFRSNIASVIRDMETIRAGIQSLSAMDIEPDLKIDRQLGLFERRLRDGIRSALNDLPPITLDDSEASTQIAELRERLFELSDVEIGVDVDADVAFAELARIEATLRQIADESMSMDMRINAAGAMKTVTAMRAELESLSRITIEPEIEVDRTFGAFERGLKGAIQNALRDLGPVADTPAGDPRFEDAGTRAVRDLRKSLFDLGDLQIGVDISAEGARERLYQIREQLEQLQRENWDVRINADTAAAAAQIGGFLAALEAVDNQEVSADVEIKGIASAIAGANALRSSFGQTEGAIKRLSAATQDGANSFRAFNIRVLGLASLLPLVVPAVGALAGVIGGLGPLAAASAAGLGVLGLALFGVGDAFKAMGEARTSAAADNEAYEKGVRTAARSVEDAQRGLSRAQLDAARASEDSSRSIRDAERGVADARAQGAQAAEQAARQVRDAERGVASARAAAAESAEQASRQVRDAERSLADAQRASQRAQEDLTLARAEAAEQLEDLTLSLRGGALAERDAVLDLREAERELAEARREGLVGDEMERYILRVDQAAFALDRTRESNADLRQESDEWARSGIEGSARVVSAQERVQQSQEGIRSAEERLGDARAAQARSAIESQQRIAQAEESLADARQAQTQVAVESQRRIADAELGLSDARRDAARQASDSNEAIADAQRNLSEAQLAYSEALLETSSAQGKLAESMSKLGPAGRQFVTFIDSLRPKFAALGAVAQEGILPGLTDWIDSMVIYHGPLLNSVVAGMSAAVGRMFADFGASIRGEEFTAFFEMIDRAGPSFMRQISDSLVNLGEGFAGLMTAMEPFARFLGEMIVNGTQGFNDWANSLQGSEGLRDFFDWFTRVGPKVADFFHAVADALVQVGIAVAPFAERMLEGLTTFFDWVAELDPNILGPIVVGILTLTVALQGIFGLTALLHSFRSALNLTTGALGVFSGTAGGVKGAAGQLGLLGAAMTVLYTQSEEARGAIDGIMEMLGNFAGMILDWIPNVESLAATLAIVVAAWKGTSVIGKGIGGLSALALNAAPGFGVFAEKVTGSAVAGERAMTAMGGFSAILKGAARTLPIAGLVIGGIGAYMEYNARKTREAKEELYGWVEASHKGGREAEEASRKLAEYRDRMDDLRSRAAELKAAQDALAEREAAGDPYAVQDQSANFDLNESNRELQELQDNLNEAQREWEEYWNGLTPVEQAQSRVTAAERTLQDVLEKHGPMALQTKDAAAQLAYEEQRLADIEGRLELAVSGVNVELLERQGLAIDLAGAQMAYEQSVGALADAHKRYQEVLADPNATEEQSRQALEAWHNQALSTAEAAKRLSESRYANADANVREQMGNAALLADLERQKGLYGELPPVLEDLRVKLSETVPEPYKIAAGFDALQLTISETPSEHGIVVTSTTQEQRDLLGKLGYEVRELPNGEFEVVALTDAAKLAIDDIVKPRTIEITAHLTRTFGAEQGGRYGQTARTGPGGFVPERARGGPIFGPGTGTSDSILARLSNGEFVVRASSVGKYGLPFLDAVNRGVYEPPAYARGGLVSAPMPRFAEGGYVASYGGTINLSGAAIPELAQWWVEALQTINEASNQTANNISRAFSGLRAALLGNFGATHGEALGIWDSMLGGMSLRTLDTTGTLDRLFGGLRDNVGNRSRETADSADGWFANLRDRLIGRSTETRDGTNGLFGQLRDWLTDRARETADNTDGWFGNLRDRLFGRSTETRDNTNVLFGQMRDNMSARAWEGVQNVTTHFNTMPGNVSTPVNTMIDRVLNNGLFSAFNSVVGSLGLDEKLKVPPSPTVRLATGGRVPGSSPHAKADNIPAWLTAGEWVQPVDSVNYYGADVMEAIRKKRIPRELLMGMDPIRRAQGGLVALGRRLQSMGALVSRHSAFDGRTPTSGHGRTSLHYLDRAIDVNTRPGTSALEQRELQPMEALARSLGFRTIFMSPGHFNHLHIDDAGSPSIGGGGGIFGMIANFGQSLRDKIASLLDGFETSPITTIMGQGARKLADLMAKKVDDLQSQMGDLGSVNAFEGGRSSNQGNEELMRAMAAGRGWVGGEWNALRALIMKESGFNNLAQNPTSTAFGQFQFLNSTWAGVGARKTSDPRAQNEAGFRYIANRYGTPSRALAFHRANNWYSEGGPVEANQSTDGGAIIPDLHDTGGWVMPGLNVLMNRTNRPEPVINPQTLDALLAIADQGARGGGALVGNLTLPMVASDPKEAVDEVMHQLAVLQAGGRYMGVND